MRRDGAQPITRTTLTARRLEEQPEASHQPHAPTCIWRRALRPRFCGYGYAGMPCAKRCSALLRPRRRPQATTMGFSMPLARISSTIRPSGCEHHRRRDDRVPVADYQRVDTRIFEAELNRVLVRLRGSPPVMSTGCPPHRKADKLRTQHESAGALPSATGRCRRRHRIAARQSRLRR